MAGKRISVGSYRPGQVIGAVAATYRTGKTTPPKRYDMATLLDLMLSADRFAETDEDRAILREVGGIGTSRTRQTIVEGMIPRGLLHSEKVGKRHEISPSQLAEWLADRIPPLLGSVVMTAKWEYGLSLVERGKVKPKDLAAKCVLFVEQLVEMAKSSCGSALTTGKPAGMESSAAKTGAKR